MRHTMINDGEPIIVLDQNVDYLISKGWTIVPTEEAAPEVVEEVILEEEIQDASA